MAAGGNQQSTKLPTNTRLRNPLNVVVEKVGATRAMVHGDVSVESLKELLMSSLSLLKTKKSQNSHAGSKKSGSKNLGMELKDQGEGGSVSVSKYIDKEKPKIPSGSATMTSGDHKEQKLAEIKIQETGNGKVKATEKEFSAELSAMKKIDDETKSKRNIGDRHRNIRDRPRNIGDRPRNIGDQPGNIGDRPRNIGDRPRNIGDRPRNIGDRHRPFGTKTGRKPKSRGVDDDGEEEEGSADDGTESLPSCLSVFSTEESPFFNDGRWLQTHFEKPLVQGLRDVANKKPQDPVGHLAFWLRKYRSEEETRRRKIEFDNELRSKRLFAIGHVVKEQKVFIENVELEYYGDGEEGGGNADWNFKNYNPTSDSAEASAAVVIQQ